MLAEIGRAALYSSVYELGEALSKTGGGTPDIDAIGRRLRRITGLFELLQAVHQPATAPA